eukprot:TRINITY_DN2928_c0_g1_i1.p1 TRINITY_DN2928_c0_g1~~TRINITY_DN2928_c0_g1_i1.p1  ORF type:complete len:923 (-),score=270.72 TRINITY_DN2928_c0_g1_i1:80-2848(-)
MEGTMEKNEEEKELMREEIKERKRRQQLILEEMRQKMLKRSKEIFPEENISDVEERSERNSSESIEMRRKSGSFSSDPLESSGNSNESRKEEKSTCRICRGEENEDEILFYPCKCRGSIKYVHQSCLFQWILHSGEESCSVCKTKYPIIKEYASRWTVAKDTVSFLLIKLFPFFLLNGLLVPLQVWMTTKFMFDYEDGRNLWDECTIVGILLRFSILYLFIPAIIFSGRLFYGLFVARPFDPRWETEGYPINQPWRERFAYFASSLPHYFFYFTRILYFPLREVQSVPNSIQRGIRFKLFKAAADIVMWNTFVFTFIYLPYHHGRSIEILISMLFYDSIYEDFTRSVCVGYSSVVFGIFLNWIIYDEAYMALEPGNPFGFIFRFLSFAKFVIKSIWITLVCPVFLGFLLELVTFQLFEREKEDSSFLESISEANIGKRWLFGVWIMIIAPLVFIHEGQLGRYSTNNRIVLFKFGRRWMSDNFSMHYNSSFKILAAEIAFLFLCILPPSRLLVQLGRRFSILAPCGFDFSLQTFVVFFLYNFLLSIDFIRHKRSSERIIWAQLHFLFQSIPLIVGRILNAFFQLDYSDSALAFIGFVACAGLVTVFKKGLKRTQWILILILSDFMIGKITEYALLNPLRSEWNESPIDSSLFQLNWNLSDFLPKVAVALYLALRYVDLGNEEPNNVTPVTITLPFHYLIVPFTLYSIVSFLGISPLWNFLLRKYCYLIYFIYSVVKDVYTMFLRSLVMSLAERIWVINRALENNQEEPVVVVPQQNNNEPQLLVLEREEVVNDRIDTIQHQPRIDGRAYEFCESENNNNNQFEEKNVVDLTERRYDEFVRSTNETMIKLQEERRKEETEKVEDHSEDMEINLVDSPANRKRTKDNSIESKRRKVASSKKRKETEERESQSRPTKSPKHISMKE